MKRLLDTLLMRPPSALEQATRELEQARRDRLTASASREHYAALEAMLTKRVSRLVVEVRELSQPSPESDAS